MKIGDTAEHCAMTIINEGEPLEGAWVYLGHGLGYLLKTFPVNDEVHRRYLWS